MAQRLKVLRPSAIAVAGGTSYILSVRGALEQVGVPLRHDIDPIYAPVMGGALVTAEAGLFRLLEDDPGMGASSATVVVASGFTPTVGPSVGDRPPRRGWLAAGCRAADQWSCPR